MNMYEVLRSYKSQFEDVGLQYIIGEDTQMITKPPIISSIIDVGKESRPGKKLIDVRAVVMHWSGIPKQSAQDIIAWFDNDVNGVYGSAPYIIDISGDIYQAIPENEVAYHVGSAESGYTEFARRFFGTHKGKVVCGSGIITPNYFTIGIEMVPLDSDGNYTESTYSSAVHLASYLLQTYHLNADHHLLMHSHIRTVAEKRCPKAWVNDPAKWEMFKADVRDYK